MGRNNQSEICQTTNISQKIFTVHNNEKLFIQQFPSTFLCFLSHWQNDGFSISSAVLAGPLSGSHIFCCKQEKMFSGMLTLVILSDLKGVSTIRGRMYVQIKIGCNCICFLFALPLVHVDIVCVFSDSVYLNCLHFKQEIWQISNRETGPGMAWPM